MIFKNNDVFKILLLSVFLSQSVFSQSSHSNYSNMTPKEKILFNTQRISGCENCFYNYFERAQAKEDIEDYSGALADYRKVNSFFGDESTYASNQIARILVKINDFRGAIIELTKLINKGKTPSMTFYFRGYCKLKLDDYRGAILDFDKAIELDSTNAVFYFARGTAKYILNQKNSACIDWSKAGELGFSNAYDEIQKNCN